MSQVTDAVLDSVSGRSQWHVAAMEKLVGVVQRLSLAREVDEVTAIVRRAARELTGADGATFVLRDEDKCYYADENAIAPLWKGQRFPMSACISGWVMLNGEPAVIEDIYQDPRIPVDAYRSTFVKSLAMVPVRKGAPIAAIGNYWSTVRQPTAEELAVLQALADTTSVALENVELYQRLTRQVNVLDRQSSQIREQRDALEIFTRAMAHDLKEPVRTMSTFSHILEDRSIAEEDRLKYLRFVKSAADRMATLITSVGGYTQLDVVGDIGAVTCDMNEAFLDVAADLAGLVSERGATLRSEPMPPVLADPVHVGQLLQNLASNAIQHNQKPVNVSVGSIGRGNRTVFYVRDDGAGVPPQATETVFTPFKRMTHLPDCSGLGLAIARKIVSLYGGLIWYETAVGGGAQFCFTLPEAQATGVAVDDLKKRDAPAARDLAHLLIVDDREDDREFIEIFLIRQPKLRCNVTFARDGDEALSILRSSPVDLILADINMPRMDGFELLECIRNDKALSSLSVIMCSGSDYDGDKARAKQLGALGYLLKPATFDSFERALAEVTSVSLVKEGQENLLLKNAA